MAYIGNLSSTEQLQIENREAQTAIALTSSRGGQQQSQMTSLTTGSWVIPPTLFRTPGGWILRIEAAQGQFFVQLAAGQINLLPTSPALLGAEILPLQPVATTNASATASSLSPLPPMLPLSPMQMGDMQMQLEPMQMRMGDMHMQIGTPSPTSSSEAEQRFCSQCGKVVSLSDRFCAQCGHRLTPQ